MRKSALLSASIFAVSGLALISTAQASSFETLSGTVKSVDATGIVQLHDGSSIVLDKNVKVEGAPSVGGTATLTYSADENGYTYETARFQATPSTTKSN